MTLPEAIERLRAAMDARHDNRDAYIGSFARDVLAAWERGEVSSEPTSHLVNDNARRWADVWKRAAKMHRGWRAHYRTGMHLLDRAHASAVERGQRIADERDRLRADLDEALKHINRLNNGYVDTVDRSFKFRRDAMDFYARVKKGEK